MGAVLSSLLSPLLPGKGLVLVGDKSCLVLVGLAASRAFPSEEDEGLICFLLVPRWISAQRILADKVVFQPLSCSFLAQRGDPAVPWDGENPSLLLLGTGERDWAPSGPVQVPPRGACDAFGARAAFPVH